MCARFKRLLRACWALDKLPVIPVRPDRVNRPSFGADGITLHSTTGGLSTDENDLSASIGAIEDLCGWYNLGNLDNLPWGAESKGL